jgi:hypothetical protein
MFGPESTGKNNAIYTISSSLSNWVPEFARDYLQENGIKVKVFAMSMT